MSNSSSVGGPGGAGATPYSSGTPDNTDQAGQTNDRRKVIINPDTGQPKIPGRPDDSDSTSPSPLSKRKVAHHTGGKTLKSMPDSGDGFKPLGGKGRSAGDGATPTGTPQRRDSQTGQPTPLTSVDPKVSVTTPEGLTPLPPLTPEQQQHKNKLVGAFKAVFAFVAEHKNGFAMGLGGLAMAGGIILMIFPLTAPIGIFPAVFGFVALTTGFSFAMMNNPGGSQPPESPKSENEEKKKKDDKPDDGSGPSSSATVKGHFAKIDHATGAPVVTVSELAEAGETSAEALAKKRELLNLQRHMARDLTAVFEAEVAKAKSSGSVTTEASLTSSALENKVLEIAAEYAVRAGLTADDDVVTKIVESGKIIARTVAEMEGMSQEERQREFQRLFASLVQRDEIPEEAVRMLCGAFDDFVESNSHLLNEAVKAAIRSTSALLKAIMDHQKKPPESPVDAPNPKPFLSTQPDTSSSGRPVSLVELEAALESVHDPEKNLQNIHHLRQLKDAIEVQGQRASMAQKDVEEVKKRLFTNCLDLLDNSLSTADFKAALVATVDPVAMSDDHEFLDKALNGHKWFRGRP